MAVVGRILYRGIEEYYYEPLKNTIMQRKTLLSLIADFLFGAKYYANIVQMRGTSRVDISSYVFSTYEEAMEHRREVEGTASYGYVETISFRSRNYYKMGQWGGLKCSVWLG